jgi:hypothetical protein
MSGNNVWFPTAVAEEMVGRKIYSVMEAVKSITKSAWFSLRIL